MNKKIIIILTIVLLIILLITFIFLRNKTSNGQNKISSNSGLPIEGIAPGILRPTTEIQPGELDIVNVSPVDMSTDLVKTSPITITFSQPVSEKEIEFMIAPELSYTKKIEGNTLVITPTEEFKTKTLYTYRIKIVSNNQKIRIYSFTTAGEGSLQRPDTAPSEENIKTYEESVRIRYPDIYLYNHTPYETEKFAITAVFSEIKNHNVFTVLLKSANKNDARSAFILWLQSLDLTDQQIAGLDIIYE